MRKIPFTISFILLLAAQVVIWNFCNFTPVVTLVFLPAMILFLPVNQKTSLTMVIAFAAGFSVDFLANGMLGLSSFALVPVALLRRPVLGLVFGEELMARNENLSFRKCGTAQIVTAILISTAIFLAFFVWADGAGMRPFSVNILMFTASLVASVFASLPVVMLLDREGK